MTQLLPGVTIPDPSRIVIVGANGSGKTRLGVFIEQHNPEVHRIPAQKSLRIPAFAPPKNLYTAQRELLFGHATKKSDVTDEGALDRLREANRWKNEPANHLVEDYDKVLSLMFALENERNRKYVQNARRNESYHPVEDSPIDLVISIWKEVMPQCQLIFADETVMAKRSVATRRYPGAQMSEGERVALYMLGQCICTPWKTIVIDEPELHLHKSILDKLFTRIEAACPDKTFIYITHDLDFAATRVDATKYWIKSFDDGEWEHEIILKDNVLPERLVLELVGNRKPVLFCEGEQGGLDHFLYQTCFPEKHVVPLGGAEKVIESVKSFRLNKSLHGYTAIGVIDRDFRSNEEIASLACSGVVAIPFAEIENLLCCEQLVRAVALHLRLNEEETVEKVSTLIRDALLKEKEAQVAMRAARRIRYHLSCYSPASNDTDGLKLGVASLLADLDVSKHVQEAQQTISEILSGSLDDILRVYNRKSLANRISSCFQLGNNGYPDLIKRLLKSSDIATYAEILRTALGSLSATCAATPEGITT